MKSKKHVKRECRKIFAALSGYVDGELDPAFCKQLEKHMSGCEPCEVFLATLRKTVELSRGYQPAVPPEPEIPVEVKRRIKAAYNEFASRMSRTIKP